MADILMETYRIYLNRWAMLLIAILAPLSAAQLKAGGAAPPGTVINNRASVTYDTEAATGLTGHSNTSMIVVQELIDVDVTWRDSSQVLVYTGEKKAVLTFLVSNTGNGVETYKLTVDNTIATEDFDPIPNSVYLDNGDGVFNPNEDLVYTPGTNDPVLDPAKPDSNDVMVFVLNDIPEDASADETGDTALTATAETGGGAPPATRYPGHGEAGTTAVIGPSGGQDMDTGTYIVKPLGMDTVKRAAVTHPEHSDLDYAITGSVITYTISVALVGPRNATGIVVTDSIPEGTTYNPGSLKLNTKPLTDEADGDTGDVGATTPGTVTVALPHMTSETPTQIVEFSVTVNSPPPNP